MFAGLLLNGNARAVPQHAPFANLTWFGWTANDIPLAGSFDWHSLVPVVAGAGILLAVGVEAFARRDLGHTSAVPTPSLPSALAGLRGPVGRLIANALPTTLSW